jgi:hypothetical protein
LSACRARADRLAGRERRISRARLVVFLAGVGTAWGALDAGRMSPWWVAVPAAAFIALIVVHDGVIRARQRAERAAAFYERGMARLEDRWAGGGEGGERFVDAHHTYAGDLDIFGTGSLFELLCTARTRAGEETLAVWLCAPAEPAVIVARQAAVQELRPRLDLREDLAVLGGDVRAGLHPEALAAWAAAAAAFHWPWARVAALCLVALVAATVPAAAAGLVGPLPLLSAFAVEALFGLSMRRRAAHVIHAVERPTRDLALLSELLARLERERFASPCLAALRARLDIDGAPPSARIASLRRRVDWLDARRNQFFAPIAPFLLWGTQCALAIEAWRARCGAGVAAWLAAVGEIEALGALAGYSYEHPADPFPEILPQGPCFDGTALGHPLLPEGRCVRNDVRLDEHLRLVIVSGSNMSGKSTLLRTVGTNTVLGLVRAAGLRLSPLMVGASLRIVDSLQTGTSHFFAEIKRLRQLVEITAGPLPLLFLLDEILHGTNSHDRRIGAEAVVRELVQRGAIGLVTTHDLALAQIVDALAPHAENVHFADHLEDGKMVFDYRMRPGVVQKSNALALMRAVGLQV